MLEVADIFREAGPAYRQVHATRLPPGQLKAMRDIEQCRTAALGGHLEVCDRCKAQRYSYHSYHSCRNRHCPKCHGEQTRRWLDTQRSRLLPVPYYLVTFTLPADLRPLARAQPKVVYAILMTAAAAALSTLAVDPQFLGGQPGMMAVLHTWTRAMLFHPHAHFLVTAAGLSPDRQRWLSPHNPRFLVPAFALSVIFRAKVRDALAKKGLLGAAPATAWARDKKWVVHLRHAGTGEKVLDYLARYVFRIAITNSRIERFANGEVCFRYRDNRSGEVKHCTLSAPDFLERFLQHVLPPGFTKVRYYGVFSSSRKADLERIKALLTAEDTHTEALPATKAAPQLPASAPDATPPHERCPVCGLGRMRFVETIPPHREPP